MTAMWDPIFSGGLFFGLSMPGTGELLLILAIVLVLFGGAKLPEIARNLGKGIREFKKAFHSRDDDSGSGPDRGKDG